MDYEVGLIHEDMINGNRRDAIKKIDEYGEDFFSEYARYLEDIYHYEHSEYSYFKDAVLTYFRIKGKSYTRGKSLQYPIKYGVWFPKTK